MHTAYEILSVIQLAPTAGYIEPPQPPLVVHLDDPAVWALDDFSHHKPITVHLDDTLAEAEELLTAAHGRVALVLDHNNHIKGLLSREDLMGDKPIRISQTRKIPRGEIPVHALMQTREQLLVIQYADLKNAKVGHIKATLMHHRKHFALVVTVGETLCQQTVCGMFSLISIGKQLGTVIRDEMFAYSLVDILKSG
jgi:CBS domain-containing protein